MTRRDPDFTFLAGPAAMSAQTLAALSRPAVTHYGDPDFRGAWRRAETMVAELMRTPGQIVLMGGEAVLGLEAAARALVRPGETRALNLVSGPYGRSMGRWLRELGADVGELSVPWNTAVDPAAVERYLDEHPGTGLLTAVHCETPCGTASDLARIGPAARSRGVLTLANCVSTLGGMPLEAAAWQLDVIVSAPHKCLGGPSGMSLVSVTDQAWAAIESNPAAPRSSYLSLLDWRERWHGKDQFPYTPFAAALAGLAAACEQALDEGLDACIARHAAAARACRPARRRWAWRCGQPATTSPRTASPRSSSPPGSTTRPSACGCGTGTGWPPHRTPVSGTWCGSPTWGQPRPACTRLPG